jgi:hypothetical protein
VIGGILNIEMESMCKEAVLTRFEVLFGHLARGTVEEDVDSVRIVAVRTEI